MNEYEEDIDLSIEPWKTLATRCWNEASPFRMGSEAEKSDVTQNPYKKPKPRALYEEGRESYRKFRQGQHHD